MAYLISTESITNILDPFTTNILEHKNLITREEIKQAIKNNDFFEIEGDDLRVNDIRKIAYLIANPVYQNIILEENFKNKFCPTPHELIASLYENPKNIIVNELNSSLNIIFELIDKDFKKYKTQNFEWNKLSSFMTDTWNNLEFIIKEIDKIKGYNSSTEYMSLARKINVDLFKNEEFIDALKNKHSFFKSLPYEIVFLDNILDIVLDNNELLTNYYHGPFSHIMKINEYFKSESNSGESYYLNYSVNELISKTNSKYTTDEILDLAKQIANKFNQKILKNKNRLSEILPLNSNLIFHFYPLLSDEFKKDPEIIKFLLTFCKGNTNYSLESLIHPDFFNDITNLEIYIKEYFTEDTNVKAYPIIYKSWINDEEKILHLSKLTYKDSCGVDKFSKFFQVLPVPLRKKEKILEVFIEKKPELYNQLSEPMRGLPRLILMYAQMASEPKAEKVPFNSFINLSFEDQLIVLDGIPNLILNSQIPESYFKNEKIVVLISYLEQINNKISQDIYEKISENKELSLKLISKDMNAYEYLSYEIKKDKDVSLFFLKKVVSTVYKPHNLINKLIEQNSFPAELLGSEDFCLNICKMDERYIPLVPNFFWKNKDFLLNIIKEIDNNNIKMTVFSYLPEEVKAMKDYFDLSQGNLYPTISSYINKIQLENTLNVNNTIKKTRKI